MRPHKKYPRYHKKPFVTGIYFCTEKPIGWPNSFLHSYVERTKFLLDNGFFCQNNSPARAFVSGVKYHGAKNGFHRCIFVGENAIRERMKLVKPTGCIFYLSTTTPLRMYKPFFWSKNRSWASQLLFDSGRAANGRYGSTLFFWPHASRRRRRREKALSYLIEG